MGPVFKTGTAFVVIVRSVSATTAQSAQAFLPSLRPKTHIYINHGAETPWLLRPGPCDYFRLATRQSSIACSLNPVKATLESAYQMDHGPKLFLDYNADGSLSV